MRSALLNAARHALGVVAVGVFGVVAGCAGGPGGLSGPPEQAVAERAQLRWDALVAGDLEKAYGYLSPATRQVVTLVGYSSATRVGFWKKAKVEKVECPAADLCEVHLTVEYRRAATIATPLKESWTRSQGEWWYVQK
jgi:hypothetical protein